MADLIFSGKYIVQEVLAKGGMGVIYKALDRKLHRLVAIKVVHEHFSGDSSFTERFLREARAMARLDHDNIITIHAVEEEHGTPYIVMEYFAGGNLRAFMQTRKPLPVRTSIEIALQVADALAYAHDQGIVHRDIKPANILVDSRGRVKLTDFGIAAALDEVSITTVGQVIGTPEYMSPEQAGCGKIDGRADLYSLGVVLYEMVVGHHPFRNHPANQTSLPGADRDGPLDFPDSVPSLVKGIIEDLVRREREYRTATARLLVSQLKECLQTLPSPPESTDEEHTILIKGQSKPRTEPWTKPLVPPEPAPYRPSSQSQKHPGEPYYSPRQTDKHPDDAGAGIETRADMPPKHEDRNKPALSQPPPSLWRRYNMLPLIIVFSIAVTMGGLVLFLDRINWTPPSPPAPTPPQSDRPPVGPKPESDETPPPAPKPSTIPPSLKPRPPKPQPPPDRPPRSPSIQAPQRQDLTNLLQEFATAYEKQDLQALDRLSDISPDRQTFLDMMVNNYSMIRISIQNVSIKNDEATATLIHEELVNKDGDRVFPGKLLRTVPLKVHRDGDHWGKVVW